LEETDPDLTGAAVGLVGDDQRSHRSNQMWAWPVPATDS
jgi:hypothetical protein